MNYSYMEFSTATGTSPWHIRRLTLKGLRLTGGIDTPSLCGRTHNGWDLRMEIHNKYDAHTCKPCLAEYSKLIKTGEPS